MELAGALGGHLPHRSEFDARYTDPDTAATMPGDAVAKSVAEGLLRRLRRPEAPAVLAAIAPDMVVAGCPARDLERACRALVGRQLETFCRRVLESWAQEGYIRD